MKRPIMAIAAMAMLASAAVASAAGGGAIATGDIIDAQGTRIGTATFTALGGDNVRVDVEVSGLTPGKHGAHIHAVGSCTAPAFTSAGGHFNPDGHEHGRKSDLGPHAGDLRNLVSLGSGANSLFDADGSAIVIHAAEDDELTQPIGNSGARVACGVIGR